ncbi:MULTISPECIES: AAA family ATPase [unclassified Brachybacterium]|uniref:AAA family ATPase n=1 Tax=unclassified Brachybacterium TaxID=2623841 RepID=UPI003608A0EE
MSQDSPTPTEAPVLVILRGNSASGKSTSAHRVQRSLPRGRVAVIGQDHVRREMLWEHEHPHADTAAILPAIARHCLAMGRITIVEGILDRERYGAMLEQLLAGHDGHDLVYYLQVSLEKTLRRHAVKPIAGEVSPDEVASWYRPADQLGVAGEQTLGEELSEDELVARILADLAARN